MIESPSRRPRIWSPKRWISFFDPPPALLRLLAFPLVQTRLSFFPRYYLVSTALCHGSTKFEAFIECLRTRRSTPTHDVYKRPSLSLSCSFRSDFLPTISFSRPFIVSRFFPRFSSPAVLVPCNEPTKASGMHCAATRTEFSACFPRLFRSALSPQIFPAKVHKCVPFVYARAVPDASS